MNLISRTRRAVLALLVGGISASAFTRAAAERLRVPDARYVTPDGAVRVVGYNDMQEMLEGLAAAFTARHPDIRFELILKGTRTAPAALIDGTSAMAPMGAEFSLPELEAYRRRYGREPLMVRIAHDSLDPRARSSPTGLLVHRNNPISELSLAEAARAFCVPPDGRRAMRWGDLGLGGSWAGRAIHPIGLSDATAIGSWMRRRNFLGLPYAPQFDGRAQSIDVVAAVAADPLALGFANLSHANGQVKALAVSRRRGEPAVRGTAEAIRAGRYPLDRHLLIYARRDHSGGPDPLVRAFLAHALSNEGQRIVASGSLGYMPLNSAELAAERAKLWGGP